MPLIPRAARVSGAPGNIAVSAMRRARGDGKSCTRYRLPGDLVWIRQRRWRIERVRRDRNVVRLDVANRDGAADLSCAVRSARRRSLDPNGSSECGRSRRWRVSRISSGARTACGRSPASSMPRSTILPHQLEPALAFAARRAPRAHRRRRRAGQDDSGRSRRRRVLRRDPAARVLVVVPAALGDQWTAELQARFRIVAVAGRRAPARRIRRGPVRGAANPWDRPGVWIASLDFLKQPHVIDSAAASVPGISSSWTRRTARAAIPIGTGVSRNAAPVAAVRAAHGHTAFWR